MGSSGELEDEEWYGGTVEEGNGRRTGEASRPAWFGRIGDARSMEEWSWKGEVEEGYQWMELGRLPASSVRDGPGPPIA